MSHAASLSSQAAPCPPPPHRDTPDHHPLNASSSSFNMPTASSSSSMSHSQPRALNKATSFADLRFGKSRLFKRFHRKGDFDFGCAGEESTLGTVADSDHAGPYSHERPPPVPSKSVRSYDTSRPSLELSLPSTSRLPAAPPPPRPAPYRFPLTAPPTAEELRRLEREREEALAAQAALEYMTTNSHARKHSRSSSLAQADASNSLAAIMEGVQAMQTGPSGNASRRPSHAAGLGATPDLAPAAPILERSISTSSRQSAASGSDHSTSSRPRTNDSLPSFVDTASTVDSNGSFPPSPVQSPLFRSRPTCTGTGGLPPNGVKVDFDAIAHQPRGYSFI
ncbi:hypothetical protein BMF94_5177 [Rhodotorula taiwanensis]|uniref:Uncharacterized protein n=1 Tax=Rhodotorula taiwanensis TaxID=741276 RepID=A0A2S5B4Y0_9BASI|nr:hypothetical protein BMF94_5177 [Rhodotorula taiwanensis]